MKRALVVAHPDDETLWFGGLLIAEPGDWTVICCSIPRTDPIRAWKFFDACALLGAAARVLPFVEAPGLPLQQLEAIDLAVFDQVVTHSAAGEYGHAHHLQLHHFIRERVPGRALFGCYGAAAGDHVVTLDRSAAARKRQVLAAYNHCSPADAGVAKHDALIARYGTRFDLDMETYARA